MICLIIVMGILVVARAAQLVENALSNAVGGMPSTASLYQYGSR